jgi:hypothetical protein
MTKHGPALEVPSAAAIHALWMTRGRVVASSTESGTGALALGLLLLPL